MLLGNSHMPILECWNCSYFPHPSPPLVHDTFMMLTNTQMGMFVHQL